MYKRGDVLYDSDYNFLWIVEHDEVAEDRRQKEIKVETGVTLVIWGDIGDRIMKIGEL